MKKLLFNVPMIVCIFSVMNVTAQPCSDCESNCTTGAVATGQCSFAACDGSRSNGLRSAALVGGYAKWTSSFSVGSSTVAHSDKSFAIGSKSEAWAPMSFTLGHKLRVDTMAFNSMVIGVGSDVLVNDIANSIMLGMNSTLSTIFVEGSSGDGTWGNVGIGNITAPASLLHVRDQIRVGLTASGGDAGAAGSLVFNNAASNTITFNTPASMSTQSYTLPTAQGANNTVLTTDASGNLSWAAPGTISNAWLTTGNTGTNATSNFLGTIDNVDLVFRTFNTEKVRVMAGGNVGIGTAAPAGKLHVNSASGNTDLVISKPDASSGRLVFHNITTETANIRLDANEDLIVEHDQSNKDIYFKINDGGADTEVMRIVGSTANVGIGTATPAARLHVALQGGTEILADMTVPDAPNDFLRMRNRTGTTTVFSPMIVGYSESQTDLNALTIAAWTNNAGDVGTRSMMDFDVRRSTSSTVISVRPLFTWSNMGSPRMQMDAAGNLGIGTTAPSGRLHVNGTVFVNYASVPAGSTLTDEDLGINPSNGQVVNLSTSSIHFKDNVENIEFDKEAFLNLRPVDYNWKEFYGGHSDVGLIAQEVAETFPPLASWSHRYTYLNNGDLLRDSTGIPVADTTQLEVSGVRYHKLPVYLLSIAKDQQIEISELRQQLQELTERLDGCCAEVGAMHRLSGEDPQQVAKTESFDEFVLLQNDPNPFRDYTDIRYEHDGCVTCEIIISDLSGRILKRIKTSGSKGVVRLYSSEIGSGLFLYSLVKDGQTVRSERMVSSNR